MNKTFFISALALVSSPEVMCGFRYDSNHCVFHYTHFSIFLPFFPNIKINIDINISFFSISRSISIFWISRFQDQDQYQYFGKSNFKINIKINMTNILKNIGKSIYCPIPVRHQMKTKNIVSLLVPCDLKFDCVL